MKEGLLLANIMEKIAVFSRSVFDPTVFHQQEFPFFTLTSFPSAFLLHVGGVVNARSVKLLDRIHNPGECSTHTNTQSLNVACPLFCEMT